MDIEVYNAPCLCYPTSLLTNGRQGMVETLQMRSKGVVCTRWNVLSRQSLKLLLKAPIEKTIMMCAHIS